MASTALSQLRLVGDDHLDRLRPILFGLLSRPRAGARSQRFIQRNFSASREREKFKQADQGSDDSHQAKPRSRGADRAEPVAPYPPQRSGWFPSITAHPIF